MDVVRSVGVSLVVLGVAVLLAGLVMGAAPEAVERTVMVTHESLVLDKRFTVGPLTYEYTGFTVPRGAVSASLDVDVVVYHGNDIDLKVYRDGSKLFEARVVGEYSGTILLPGPGSYEVRFDNSYSLLTSKDVEARLVLKWSEPRVERREIAGLGLGLMAGGVALIAAGAVAYYAGSRAGARAGSAGSGS